MIVLHKECLHQNVKWQDHYSKMIVYMSCIHNHPSNMVWQRHVHGCSNGCVLCFQEAIFTAEIMYGINIVFTNIWYPLSYFWHQHCLRKPLISSFLCLASTLSSQTSDILFLIFFTDVIYITITRCVFNVSCVLWCVFNVSCVLWYVYNVACALWCVFNVSCALWCVFNVSCILWCVLNVSCVLWCVFKEKNTTLCNLSSYFYVS